MLQSMNFSGVATMGFFRVQMPLLRKNKIFNKNKQHQTIYQLLRINDKERERFTSHNNLIVDLSLLPSLMMLF
jgi:hypothetical protein